MEIDLYQIDSFTDTLFKGNPAAVCPLSGWLSDERMQQIASENNLSETAFFVAESSGYSIRWFTPTTEVDLCGHATLAAAYVIFNELNNHEEVIRFETTNSGVLKVSRSDDKLIMDFPVDAPLQITLSDDLINCTDQLPLEAWQGKDDIMLIFERQSQIAQMMPNLNQIAQLKARGLIATAPGNEVDFVSRFFGPQSGVNEDPVTGSAHTTLTPYWANVLQKTEMMAQQLSKRSGTIQCQLSEDRVLLSGQAQLYMKGQIHLKD
jgi:PhzF family phenazine biosynthesis protein